MRIVSFFASLEGTPGFGGKVMRTVAFLEGIGSGDDAGGVSAAISKSTCIALCVQGVNSWFQEIDEKVLNFCLLVFCPISSLPR